MVWNFKKNLRPFKFASHTGPVYGIDINPTGNIIASASSDRTIRLWTNSIEAQSKVLKSHTGPVRDLAFSCDGQLLLSCSDDKTLKLWNIVEKKFITTI
jgi:centriolar protein POC1